MQKPAKLVVFKELPEDYPLANIKIPELPENRKPTDKIFLILFLVSAVHLIPFLIYTLFYSDIHRLGHLDNCGNICGRKNEKDERWNCTGQDFTNKKYLQSERDIRELTREERVLIPSECVSACHPEYRQDFNYCFKTVLARGFDTHLIFDNGNSEFTWINVLWRIALAWFFALGVTLVLLVLFRSATAVMVWTFLIVVPIFAAIVTSAIWYFFVIQKHSSLKWLVVFLTIPGASLLTIFFIMIFLYKRVNLVIGLLKQAVIAAFAMPQLICIPITSFIVQAIILVAVAITDMLILSSGILTEVQPGFLYYKLNPVMKYTLIFNNIMACWALLFISGIQYMIIGGAVSKWYFAPNKEDLGSPVKTSARVTFKFHLGSIAFGSLIITIFKIIHLLLQAAAKNDKLKLIVEYCLSLLERFLKYLTKNSYILTAMHGKPFWKSGKRGAEIIFDNILDIIAIDCVGSTIIFVAQCTIVFFSILVTYCAMIGVQSEQAWIVYLIVGLVSFTTAYTLFALIDTVIDTMFLCFCEDSLLNDGVARPYAMTRDLMEFVDKSKTVFKKKQGNDNTSIL